jgi:cell wall-associated NlpC family hydrolase
VHTPERERRTSSNARRLAATASLAAATIVGTAVGSTPAHAAELTAATPVTPIATLVANHSSVTVGHAITFSVSDRTKSGTAVPSARATFYVHTVHGWKKVTTKTLSTKGTATFTFHPNYDHAYKVDLASVTTAAGLTYRAVNTPSVTVKAKAASIGKAIVAEAAKQKGKPYRYGAAGPNAFDCSGLTKYVFAKFHISLPHHANSQKAYGTRVSAKNAEPGDLVFVLSGSHATHVAIYAGNGKWWEAPTSGEKVREVKIWSSHVEYRRVR